MRLSIYNPNQQADCMNAVINFNGIQIKNATTADSDEGWIERLKRDHRVDVVYRQVGTVRKPVIERVTGVVEILLKGKINA